MVGRPVFGKGDALDRLFSSDYQEHNPLIANGTAAIKAIKAIIAGLSPLFKYEPGLAVADGEHVSIIHGRYRLAIRQELSRVLPDQLAITLEAPPKYEQREAICMSPHSHNRNRGVADEQRLMERTGA